MVGQTPPADCWRPDDVVTAAPAVSAQRPRGCSRTTVPRVVIADIDADSLGWTSSGAQLRPVGVRGGTDVRDAGQVAELARSVLERHGRVDVLVDNVGHWLRRTGDFVDADPQLWDDLSG